MTSLMPVAILLCGMICGHILRGKPYSTKYLDTLIAVSVYLLLFLLGVSLGRSLTTINSLASIGFDALMVAGLSIFGSAICANLAFRKAKRSP